jgi:hypothetical protein
LSTQGSGTADDGDGGDPVLAVDSASSIVYLAGTSSRNAGWKGIPLWKSTDGINFGNPTNAHNEITFSDKPWIAVDNAAGTGQHDVYLTCTGTRGTPPTNGLWLAVSTDGSGANWSSAASLLTRQDGTIVTETPSAIPIIGSDHVGYVFWFEKTNNLNWIKMRTVQNRGATLGPIVSVRQLATTGSPYGNLALTG